jgi:hypothetical protein
MQVLLVVLKNLLVDKLSATKTATDSGASAISIVSNCADGCA